MNRRVLFAAAEYDGLAKAGGLADVASGLPRALIRRGWDVRVLLPAYGCIRGLDERSAPVIARIPARSKSREIRIREFRRHEDTEPVVWLADTPSFRRREQSPYELPENAGWQGDALAFGDFCRAAAALCADDSPLPWRPDLAHANDWHCGLVSAYLLLKKYSVPCIFTVHNLAYQGRFPAAAVELLDLPGWMLHTEAAEFHGGLSFMKAGLTFADAITTVSEGYAAEILTPVFGEGLDGVLGRRKNDLHGILNGIDTSLWNPEQDPFVAHGYSAARLSGKTSARENLLHSLHLDACDESEALFVFVGRLAAQKGLDILMGALPRLMQMPLRIAVLGKGDPLLQQGVREAALRYRGRFALRLRYDEVLAHRFFAGGDMLLMPSHFEPCGLAQMYAMRYGTIPVCTAVGGLRDTIVDATPENIAAGRASGILFEAQTVDALIAAIERALQLFRDRETWTRLMRAAMRKEFGWDNAARKYERLYSRTLARGSDERLRTRLRRGG